MISERLPEKFLERIKGQLQDEYEAFIKSYDQPCERGIRVNTLKVNKEIFEMKAPFKMEPIPWVEGGCFIDKNENPAGHPYYKAGVYYIQEPSAMTPADRLPIEPNDKVLDLCAAPGGKSTRLAGKLQREGLLVSNDISTSRCKALLHNLELTGAGNIIVTNEQPAKLETRFTGFFDKILVDAPCSGEGMFRKDEAVIETWLEQRVENCAKIQRGILECAMNMLKPGGLLMYSTCTFAPAENEQSISYVLEKFPDTEVLEIPGYEGFSQGVPQWGNGDLRLKNTVRIWPHKMRGEGHYLALLKKGGSSAEVVDIKPKKQKEKNKTDKYNNSFTKEEKLIMDEFLKQLNLRFVRERFENRAGRVFYMPFDTEKIAGLRFMRCGLYMGEMKKKRFEPSQALALYLKPDEFANTISFSADDPRTEMYLKGENMELEDSDGPCENGWVLVAIDGFSLGFAKKNSNFLKNKYLWLR